MFVGKTIKSVRWMTDDEMEQEGWETGGRGGPGIVLELSDGIKIYPSRDPEGNGPGALFGVADGEYIRVQPAKAHS